MGTEVLPKEWKCDCRSPGGCTNRVRERGWVLCRPCAVGWHLPTPCKEHVPGRWDHLDRPPEAASCGRCGYARGEHGTGPSPARGG